MLVMTILEAVATFSPPASPVYTIMIVIPSFALRNIAACHVYRKTKLGVISDGSLLTSSSPSEYFASSIRFISNLPNSLAGIPSPVEMISIPTTSSRTLVTESRDETVDEAWTHSPSSKPVSPLPLGPRKLCTQYSSPSLFHITAIRNLPISTPDFRHDTPNLAPPIANEWPNEYCSPIPLPKC